MEDVNQKEEPDEFDKLRKKVLRALSNIQPAGSPRSEREPMALMLSSTTRGWKSPPPYYLIYFMFVDLLKFPRMGSWEKSAWTIPVRYRDRLYALEHQKMGLRICAPNEDPTARMSGRPSEQQQEDSDQIAIEVGKALREAGPYFDWRAEQEAKGNRLNVLNHSNWLFERYLFFKRKYIETKRETERMNAELMQVKDLTQGQSLIGLLGSGMLELSSESEWVAQAAVDAFFSWSEHAFIHVAILRGRITNGLQVADLAAANWKDKFRAALDLDDPYFKVHYEKLLQLRIQLRNFMAHGAFGKRGEAFLFHSDAGAVPLLLGENGLNRYLFSGAPAFNEAEAIENIEVFLAALWSSELSPVKSHLFSAVPSILTSVTDGKYVKAMCSSEAMSELVQGIERQIEAAANMEW
ncbi:MAG: hypothetical protein V4660_08885 [Pseudomonadota bacterium]